MVTKGSADDDMSINVVLHFHYFRGLVPDTESVVVSDAEDEDPSRGFRQYTVILKCVSWAKSDAGDGSQCHKTMNFRIIQVLQNVIDQNFSIFFGPTQSPWKDCK